MGHGLSAKKSRTLSLSRALLLSTSALVALALTPMDQAFAQQANSPAASSATDSGEIVVTARRRDESLSRTPIAVTALSAEALQERAVRTDSDLQLAAPGLTIRQTQGNNSLTYSLRGQTADTFSGTPSAVVTYLNEVPLSISGASTFYDLQSVQVLKGPQGTLFGRNATGGAVLYTSAQPTDEFEALARARVGNLDLREVEGMINVPLAGDQVMLRTAFNKLERDGYIHNLFNGQDLGELDRFSGRVSLTIAPNDNFENRTMFQGSHTGGTNTGASYVWSVYSAPGDNCAPVGPVNCASSFLAGEVETQRELGPYRTRHPGPARHRGDDWMLTNTTEWSINPNLRFRNILGASHAETDSEQPQLGAPFFTIQTANVVTGDSGNELQVESISEEFQVQGDSGNLTYVAGVYLQSSDIETVWPQTYFELPITAVTNAFRTETESKAIYAQGTWDLSSWVENLRFTAGLRYTWEDIDFTVLERDTRGVDGVSDDQSFEEPSWEVGLEYQATPEWFTYLKTRGSFRSGGFNGAAPAVSAPATEGGNLFDAETTEDIELGFKYRGEVLGRPASLNIALYQQWIHDVQRVEFPDPDGAGPVQSIAVTANVPEMEVRGIEIDGSIMPTDWLELGASAAYTDAEFTENEINLFGTEYRYGPVGDTPEWSGVVYAQVNFATGENIGDISLRGEVYSQTEQYFGNTAATIGPRTRLPGYTLLSGRLQWADMFGSNATVALFGKNLTDEEYFVGGMTLASALGHNAAAVGEPRTYGIELSYRY